ncbi:hypothetical protein FRACYDRAFT_274577 [Fragilariopsis cylindrus CCMP1102]|uniref:Uncharacterized protein n=1 Tax=Fragilariopsis cylindrus CCMP1102 TaxID=635003 RepID=A0A1E7FNK1_9STRA|nr:hypothetical protein FRACYDRAFT_274577 [Fragilariopsis cylindrus CCMP1102]|eukprot:OEU19749.1 hypothetical protein FRACYDRAFT_274577 [Fragilariopsis cylindrus CCMP1102]
MASSLPRARVLAGFRRLNRARIQIFRGDDHAMVESRNQLRDQIMANRSVPTSGPVFEELVNGLDEATQMLTHEIVRGDLNEETGRYNVKIEREHVQGSSDPSGTIKPEIEPITEDTVRRMENPGSVEVCKSSSSNNKN